MCCLSTKPIFTLLSVGHLLFSSAVASLFLIILSAKNKSPTPGQRKQEILTAFFCDWKKCPTVKNGSTGLQAKCEMAKTKVILYVLRWPYHAI